MHVEDFPYMKEPSSSTYLDYWGQTKTQNFTKSTFQMAHCQTPTIAHICCHWHLPSQVSPKEIKQWINLEELNEMIGVVGEKSTTRYYNMEITFMA